VLARNVGAVDVAELALEAFVDDLVLFGDRQLSRVLVVVLVDELEERRERRAVLETQTTTVAEVVDTRQLFPNVGLVEVLRMVRVVGDRQVSFLFFAGAYVLRCFFVDCFFVDFDSAGRRVDRRPAES
jgi:hypothetical protein